jgi:acetylornithine deacetylase/succinyl-diaminopimelate desuccinylase-like protein
MMANDGGEGEEDGVESHGGREDFHAPNEFFRVHRLHEGLEAWARFWEILGGASA